MKNRRPTRLKTHNYSTTGSYFVTTCVLNHQCCFGYIINGKMQFNQYGKIATQQLDWVTDQYAFVAIKVFSVMPNHVHAIIEINPGDMGTAPLNLSQIVAAYKTRVSKAIHLQGLKTFSWQRSFYDHLIRNQYSYDNIAAYIKNNPLTWEKDRFFKK